MIPAYGDTVAYRYDGGELLCPHCTLAGLGFNDEGWESLGLVFAWVEEADPAFVRPDDVRRLALDGGEVCAHCGDDIA